MILGCDLYNIINHKLSSVCVYSSFHLIYQQWKGMQKFLLWQYRYHSTYHYMNKRKLKYKLNSITSKLNMSQRINKGWDPILWLYFMIIHFVRYRISPLLQLLNILLDIHLWTANKGNPFTSHHGDIASYFGLFHV